MSEPVTGQMSEYAPPEDPRVGSTLGGRYRIVAALGEGGMGTVYRGVHEALRKPVAIKFLQQKIHGNREMVARFEREAVTAANLRHPNIAEAIDYGSLPDGTLYLVMELVDGVPLRKLIEPGQGLPIARVLRILEQIAAALDLAHSMGIVHRDLKPENILVFDRGSERDVVKIIDFGIARINSETFNTNPTALTQAGAIFGTPQYMAPEQVMGQPVDGRADQYALGVIAFEMLTGTQPFVGENFAELVMKHVGAPVPSSRERVPSVPQSLDEAVSRMLAKLPDERYASVSEAMRAMTGAVDLPPQSMQIPAGPVSASTVIMTASTTIAGASTDTRPIAFAATAMPGELPPLATVTLPSATPKSKWSALDSRVKMAIGGAAAFLLLLILLVARCSSGSSAAVKDVIAQWNDHQYSAAALALRAALKEDPKAADDPELAKALAASLREPAAKAALDSLLETTQLGKSNVFAASLADLATTDESPDRDPALDLLRERDDLLTSEQRSRVRLRNAEDCPKLLQALAELEAGKTDPQQADVDRYRRGECRKMIRKDQLCGICLGASNQGQSDDLVEPKRGKGKGKPKWK